MKLRLDRYALSKSSTVGFLWEMGRWGQQTLLCATLEDRVRRPGEKIAGKTAIPDGTYDIRLRRVGGMVRDYDKRYGHVGHDGMLWLQDVDSFEWVYLHVGNTDKHSAGCILVGNAANVAQGTIQHSVLAYERIYPRLYLYANKGDLTIEVGYSEDLTRRHIKQWQKEEDE